MMFQKFKNNNKPIKNNNIIIRKVNLLGSQNSGELKKIVIQDQVQMIGQELVWWKHSQSWRYFFTYQMIKLAKIYDSGVVKNLVERTELILNKMKSDMLDPNHLIYKDILYYPNTDDQLYFPHRGYVNLFPLGLGLIDKSIVDLMQQHLNFTRGNTMWTPFGIQDLQRQIVLSSGRNLIIGLDLFRLIYNFQYGEKLKLYYSEID